jgi:mono/diheme cytochrome c family protein
MKRMKAGLLYFTCGFLFVSYGAVAGSTTDFFEKKIRPILVENCYECHGEKKQKGGLRLDSRAGWEKGGDSGAAIVPGDVEKSLVIKGVRYTDPDFQMPPKKKLSSSEIADLEKWVRDGALDPREGALGLSIPDQADRANGEGFGLGVE